MLPPHTSDPELLKSLLEPLLDDFQHWLGRAQVLLTEEDLSFLATEAQQDLLARVNEAVQAVNAAKGLFLATNYQVGVDRDVILHWHQLTAECWQVMIRHRLGEVPPQ